MINPENLEKLAQAQAQEEAKLKTKLEAIRKQRSKLENAERLRKDILRKAMGRTWLSS